MKKFIHKVQELGKKAAEVKQAIHAAPGKAAEIREALTMTAGEFQQLRTDVQSNVNGLRANNEDRLLQAMREVNDNTYTFEEAGYELTGMDLDLTLAQRLAVHLQKFEDVPHVKLRALLGKESCETIRSILAGLLKAEESAANVEFTHLKYDGVIMHIGAIPLIRMTWRSDTFVEQQTSAPSATKSESLMPASQASGTFFEQRAIPLSTAKTVPSLVNSSPAFSEPIGTEMVHSKEASTTSPWGASALDRFKKMPDLSKHRASR